MNMAAARAYRSQAARGGMREQEADVFRRATGGLRAAKADPSLLGRAEPDLDFLISVNEDITAGLSGAPLSVGLSSAWT